MASSHLYYTRETDFTASMLIGNSRAGQKGTVGLVVPEQDMPFTKDGIRPDIIINPHAIPSRMTIGHLVECITGKAGAIYGGFVDSTAFNNKGSKIKVFGEMLTKVGYHSSGNEILYNGMTGEQLETEIFIGPNYYMRLKHMVKDKINYRALGPRTALTKQPVGGRANDGGLRIGEMERDSVISHGAADFLRESMMERGDKYQLAVCNTTGLVAIYNPSKNIFMSPMADGPIKFVSSLDGKDMRIEDITKFGRSFSIISVPYSLKLLIQELQTINVQLRIITEDNIKQLENLSYSTNIEKLLFDKDTTPKSIVGMIKKTINAEIGKSDVYATPENIVFKTPSPDYPETSPAYQSSQEESIKRDGSSPGFNPFDEKEGPTTPDFPPPPNGPTTPDFPPPPNGPTTPDFSPPSSQTGGIKYKMDLLSEEASTYNVGERVHYRGDFIPNRLWKITEIGDRFLTVETENTQGLEPMDTTKIVTASDIYREGNYSNSVPFEEPIQPIAGLYNTFDETNYPTMPMTAPMISNPNIPPSINFAPVIKVMNGGSDFSTDSGENAMNGNPSNNLNSQQITSQSGGSALGFSEIIPTTNNTSVGTNSTSAPTGPVDFGNLVIKKV